MSDKKASERLLAMRRSGEKAAYVMDKLLGMVAPGVALVEIDKRAEELIAAVGGKAAFKQVPGYKHATCINVNGGVVHGIPGNYKIKEGDVVTVDVGVNCRGWITDVAWTVVAGGKSGREVATFLEAGQRALRAGVAEVVVGKRIGDISAAIDGVLTGAGVRAFSALTGHGVGRKLHEWPNVPNVATEPKEKTAKIKEGMTLALEVIYTSGKDELVKLADGWTLVAGDDKITASFEVTCGATMAGPEVLTPISPWCKNSSF